MAIFHETILPSLLPWISAQKVLWVATAPLSGTGHVNVSPKGCGDGQGNRYCGVVDERTFWYLDLTGSGNETISHLLERGNGRVTVMFSAFEGAPRILRFWGRGRVLENHTPAFTSFTTTHSIPTHIPGTRTIVIVDIHQVGSSCGFSVPFYDFKEFRPVLNDFFAKKQKRYEEGKEEDSMDRYWAYKNAWSMDGLPGMQRAGWAAKEFDVAPIKKMVGPLAPTRYQHGSGFRAEQVVLIAFMCFMLGIAVALYGPGSLGLLFRSVKVNPPKTRLVNLKSVPFLGSLMGTS